MAGETSRVGQTGVAVGSVGVAGAQEVPGMVEDTVGA